MWSKNKHFIHLLKTHRRNEFQKNNWNATTKILSDGKPRNIVYSVLKSVQEKTQGKPGLPIVKQSNEALNVIEQRKRS